MSNTITTWVGFLSLHVTSAAYAHKVVPVIDFILPAQFESSQNFNSFLALARWIGNPIASMSYVLWNIKITGKCAMMVDMATTYDEFPKEDSQFAQMRDSLYIHESVQVQLAPESCIHADWTCFADRISRDLVKQDDLIIAAEKLLRIFLFSDELPITTEASLTDRRKKLTGTIRAFRKKGLFPVLVSTL